MWVDAKTILNCVNEYIIGKASCNSAVKTITIMITIIYYWDIGKKYKNLNIMHINNLPPAQIGPTRLYKMNKQYQYKQKEMTDFADSNFHPLLLNSLKALLFSFIMF